MADLVDSVYASFSDLAGSLGYSPVHGKIIAFLLVKGGPAPLEEVAKGTGYSLSMVSLSLDLLEVIGLIKRSRRPGDRKLYIELEGDLLDSLKKAVVMKLRKGISTALSDLSERRKEVSGLPKGERESTEKALGTLEGQIKRLNRYIDLLASIRLP